jgi:hypothetical protein
VQAPKIETAIPQRRYQLGPYQAVVLGEIESGDGVRYQHILALVRDGESTPSLYVIAEKNPRARRSAGACRLRVVSEALTEDLDSSDRWTDLDAFVEEGLRLAAQVLGLGELSAERLM